MADFNKVGLLVTRDNSFLTCRKGDYTSKLLMPGGQIEPGETDVQCLLRETHEELGDNVDLDGLTYFGTYLDQAASDDPSIRKTVEIRLYTGILNGVPVPSSEIVELKWFGSHDDPATLSPIILDKILPDLLARGALEWG